MGRDRELLSERDQAILARFSYWSDEKRIRFDDVLRYLSKDYISEERVLKIICRGKRVKLCFFIVCVRERVP
jgi:hypothetical protein